MSALPRALTFAPREEPDPDRQQWEEMEWAIDRDYWLSRCQGFAVEEGERTVGEVDSIEYERRIDVPDFILVRTGRFSPRMSRIPVAEVEHIWPSERVIVIRESG